MKQNWLRGSYFVAQITTNSENILSLYKILNEKEGVMTHSD